MNMNPSSSFKLVVLISGNGSNLQAIIDAEKLNAMIAAVISDKEDAFGLQRAAKANIPTHVIKNIDQALEDLLEQYSPDLIILAGFMRILDAGLVKKFKDRIINIHPSLLPKYKGLNTHQKVLEAGDQEHGTSIHFVTEDLDAGPIIAQSKLNVFEHETVEDLRTRVQALEYQLYPEVIQWFVEGKI